MSFGRPPTFSDFKVSPPERGSFPLDHEGECKTVMQSYLRCMKLNKNDNGKCRHLSKDYLQCRMDKGLMENDNMTNLGFQDTTKSPITQITSSSNQEQAPSAPSAPSSQQQTSHTPFGTCDRDPNLKPVRQV